MLACMMMLPYPDSLNVIRAIAAPVMIIYPVATLLLCLLLLRQQAFRQTRNELKQSKERFKLLFDKAPLGYQSLDCDGYFRGVNQQWCNILGYSQDEVIGKWFGDFLSPDYRDVFRQRFPLFKEQGYIQSEFEMLHKSGNLLFISFNGKIGYGADGQFEQTHCILQDITSQKVAEDALAESEKKYRNIAENVSDVVWQTDLNLKMWYISPSVEKLLGESAEEHMKRTLEEKFPEQTRIEILSMLQEELEKEKCPAVDKTRSRTIEVQQYKADGSIIWVEMSVSFLRDQLGNAIALQGVSRDITKRKLADQALEESERSKSVLIANLPGMAYRCNYDREWTMQFVSAGSVKLTGYPPESLINNRDLSFAGLIAPEYRDYIWTELERILPRKLPFEFEYEITTKSGERKWVLEMGEGVYDNENSLEALEGIILDISDRKRAEEQLKQSLERTQSMINDHEAVMLLVEPATGQILEANRAATSFYGFSKNELLKMTIQDIFIFDDDEIAPMRLKALRTGQKCFTLPHHLKSGEIKMVDVYSSPIDYGGTKALFSIIFDVTKREEIAQQNEFLAYHDYLTSLYNRRYFEEEFERRISNSEFPIALLLGDIDGFKSFNDTFGHSEGDRIIKEAAGRVSKLINNEDVLARIGGDEFAIIVSGKTEAEIKQYLDMLEQEYNNAQEDASEEKLPTISWGYGIQRHKDDTVDVLNEEAEAFMYNRKFYSHKSARSKTVDVIMKALFTKSEREEKHSKRVSNLCEIIAQQMHLSQSDIDKVRVAGLLHDLGKIVVDEAVLNKPDKLDAQEWELMKLHPAKGAGILENTVEYRDISDIVLSHHEYYDGTGYPSGLKGEQIPLGSRIIAVADAYDAITNERPYKKAIDAQTAISEIRRCAGKQFDPEIVRVFLDEAIGGNCLNDD